ncbi:hypothetical protein Tco_0407724 [Tanacetum coccineum]
MDEDDMDKAATAADPSTQLKRKRDEKDKDPSVGPNQEKKTKRRRTKEYESSKKSSTSKETSKGNTLPKDSCTDKPVNAEETVTKPTEEVTMDAEENIINDDVVNDADQPQDDAVPKTDNAPKNNWFKPPPRPPTPDLKWNKCRIVDDQPEQTWFNDLVSAEKDLLTFDELMATPIDFFKFAMNHLKLEKVNKADLVGLTKPDGDICPYDLSKPLPLKGRLGHLTVPAEHFFNNDLEYLKSKNLERKYTTSITKTKAARYELVGIEDMIPNQWSVVKLGYNKDVKRGISHWGPKRQLFYRSQINRLSKHDVYSTLKILSVVSVTVESTLVMVVQHKLFHLDEDAIVDLAVALHGMLKSVQDTLHHRLLNIRLGYNKDMPRRKWIDTDQRRLGIMVKLTNEQLLKRQTMHNLERLVGARELETDYRLMQWIV